jgi:hypothetical protein
MTRAKSVVDGDMEETTDVRMMRSRGMTKDSIALELVQKQSTHIKLHDVRLDKLESTADGITEQIRIVREGQIESKSVEKQILEKLVSAEQQRAEAKKAETSKNDMLTRNIFAFGSLVVAIVALSLNRCG